MKRIVFAVLPALLVLAGVETAAFLYRLGRCPGHSPTFAVPNAKFGWTHPPARTVEAFGCDGTRYEWRQRVTFNSDGLNDDELAPAGSRSARILVLGDSVTEALQVPRNENFSERMQVMLSSGARKVEVVNAGHSGFGTDNSLLYFEEKGAGFAADVVVLAFNLQNDIAENSEEAVARMYAGGPRHPKASVRIAADDSLVFDTTDFARAAVEADGAAIRWLREHSFLARRLLAVMSNAAPATEAAPPYPFDLDVYAVPADRLWSDARRITEKLLLRLREAVEATGAVLVVAVVPSRETAAPERWARLEAWFPSLASKQRDLEMPRRWLLEFLEQRGFRYVDTTEVIRDGQRRTGRLGYFDFDPHPDGDGHRWIAEALAPALEAELAN